jgi:hypothetical protein
MDCPRKFGYRYKLGYTPLVTPRPLALGTCVHDALEAYYGGNDPLEALRAVHPSVAYCAVDAEPMVRAYIKHYADETLEILDREREYEVTVGGEKFTRKIDLTVRKNKRVYAWDHKTAADPYRRLTRTQYDGALFTQQIVGAATFQQIYGLVFGGVVINVLGKKTPYSFARKQLKWERYWLQQVPDSLAYWANQAEALLKSDLSGWSYPQSWRCVGEYGICEYTDLCKYGRRAEGQFRLESEGA